MRVVSEDIKLQNFNMNLQIDKQKEKYDNIILKYQEDLVFRQETKDKFVDLETENKKRIAEQNRLNKKIDDAELGLLQRVKSSDIKF